jgi:hypothetical protein
MVVMHVVLYETRCRWCRALHQAERPTEYRNGYGPQLAALLAERSSPQRASRSAVQVFCTSVLGMPINRGAVQRAVDRVAEAFKPYYEAIAEQARWAKVGHRLAPPDHSLIVIVGANPHP